MVSFRQLAELINSIPESHKDDDISIVDKKGRELFAYNEIVLLERKYEQFGTVEYSIGLR
jgi:hypothetical protein